jgi:hypothetical protein
VGILNAVLTDAISRFEKALIAIAEAKESESSPEANILSVVGQVPDLPLPALAVVLKARENDDQLELLVPRPDRCSPCHSVIRKPSQTIQSHENRSIRNGFPTQPPLPAPNWLCSSQSTKMALFGIFPFQDKIGSA